MERQLRLYRSGARRSSLSYHSSLILSSQEILEKDVTPAPNGDKPLWPLTSFGPGKHVPNLTQTLDESPEELRWKAVQAKLNNTVTDYVRV